MVTFRIYLDRRGIKKGAAPLKVSLTKQGSTTYIGLGVSVLPSQWDAKSQKIHDHPQKTELNYLIENRKSDIVRAFLSLQSSGSINGKSVTQIKEAILGELEPESKHSARFIPRFEVYTNKQTNFNTKEKYKNTLNRIIQFDPRSKKMSFEDISKDWLSEFDRYLLGIGNSTNTRSIHMRNIRTVVNDAIDNGITSHYPFRTFKIKNQATPKRSLTIEQLRALFRYECEPWQQRYIDVFKLSFFLIGINPVDLCGLTDISADGRLVYSRAKTHRLYNIKVEPEAMELINSYRGSKHLLRFAEDFNTVHTFVSMMDKGLKSIGPKMMIHNQDYTRGCLKHKYHIRRISAFPGLSLYWARHTWATIASRLDIPDATISAALGHGHGNPTTAIYVNFDTRKIDEANRKVIDYVLGDEP